MGCVQVTQGGLDVVAAVVWAAVEEDPVAAGVSQSVVALGGGQPPGRSTPG